MAEQQFCTLEQAEAYFATRLRADAWHGASESDRAISLIQATRLFNTYLVWKQTPVAGEIPETLIHAACELALDLLQDDPMVRDSMEGLSRIKLGELELEAGGKGRRVIPAYILAMLAGLADLAVSGCSIPIVRT